MTTFYISLLKLILTLSVPPHQFYNMEELKIQVFSFISWYHFNIMNCLGVLEDAETKFLALT